MSMDLTFSAGATPTWFSDTSDTSDTCDKVPHPTVGDTHTDQEAAGRTDAESSAPADGSTQYVACATAGATAGATAADTAPTDTWELVYAAQTGDATAFGHLYDQYVDVVFRYVLFRLGDRELAEDTTSETFLRALRRLNTVSYQGRDVGAWFITIARNLVFDHAKSSRVKREVVTSELAESGPTAFAGADRGTATEPEQQVITLATNDELFRCIESLGDDQRDCVVLRFIQGLSVAETAHIMERNEGAIKALQHRAVRRLAHILPNGTG